MYTNDEWAVAATGAVHVDNDDNLLKIRDEETEKTLFYGLLPHDQYQIEGPGNLVVTWNDDKTGSECALSRRAAAGRAQLLAKKRHTDRLQNPAKLRRFRIGGGIGGG